MERQTSKTEADMRIAPDPFTAVLPGLAALGAIASIAAINWMAQERTPDRSRTRRKAVMALRDLESCCLKLQDLFRGFQRNSKVFVRDGAGASSPMKFGVMGARVDGDSTRAYHQSISDVASVLVIASHNSFEAMSAIEDGEIDAPEEVYYGFGEQQERLNKLMQGRAPLKVSVDGGLEIASALTDLVRKLKEHLVE